jgi:hypothetical protein
LCFNFVNGTGDGLKKKEEVVHFRNRFIVKIKKLDTGLKAVSSNASPG